MNLMNCHPTAKSLCPLRCVAGLHLVPGDKVLFLEKENGEVVVVKAELAALARPGSRGCCRGLLGRRRG